MKCDVCGCYIKGKIIRPGYCKDIVLCEECNSIELVKATDDRDEMITMIKLSKKESYKRQLRNRG